MHRDFRTFHGTTPGELLAWLNRILERQLANHVRHYRFTLMRNVDREVSLDDEQLASNVQLVDQGPRPGDEAALADDQRRLRIAIQRLPADYRRVLELRAWGRLPFVEIGRQMDRSGDAAEKLWLRALERLQADLRSV